MNTQQHCFFAIRILVAFFLIQECCCELYFTRPKDWIRVGEIYGIYSTRVILWKPVCERPALRLGDVGMTVDFPPRSDLYCVQVELVDAIPADTIVHHFEIQNNLILSATALDNRTASIGWFASGIEGGKPISDHIRYYVTFKTYCLRRCRNFQVISPLGLGTTQYSLLTYNPYQLLGFYNQATLFIMNDTSTSIELCLSQDCVCGPCEHGVCTEFGACYCELGWTGRLCNEDIDECALGIHECDPLVTCINTPGSYKCGPCPPGYIDKFGNGRFCQGIDKCKNESICKGTGFVNCTNLPGTFACTNCSIGWLDRGQGCELVLCGNRRIDEGEQCDSGLQCKDNCHCAHGYEPTNPISIDCQRLCGNRRLDPGEECDSGYGCNKITCKCNRNLRFFPTSPPSLDCVQILSDPCVAFTNCSACVSMDCLWCADSSLCRRTRQSTQCLTKCAASFPVVTFQPSNSQRRLGTGLIIVIVVSIVVLLLLSGGIVGLVLWRRHKRRREQYYKLLEMNETNKNTTFSKYGIERSDLYISTLVQEWEPPQDSKAVPLNELPFVISKEQLNFNVGLDQFRVGQNYFDSFVISIPTVGSTPAKTMTTTKTKTNTKNQKLESIEIVFHPPKTPKFNVIFNPERCVVKKDKPVEIIVSLVVNMTTETEIATGIEVPELKVHSFLIQRISSELSPLIDIDEVRTDNTKIVGDGAYGTVYRGEYRGQDVAVKILKIQDLPEDMLDEFDREIDLMTKLRHKNIVQFVGASKVVGKLAIVTEFIEGGNVTNLLKKPISFALKLKIALDTARALNFLQQNKILHRDLKPDNLLVVSKSTDPLSITVKLADFGTSRAVSEKLANKYTMGIGTPIYMAPEILAKKQYDLKADIYSFGMILWVLYTQQEPYTFLENSWDVAKFVLDGHREKIPQDCPNDYRKLIERCWDGDPNNRPSCEEIISQLEQMLRAELNKTQKNQPINFIPDPNVYVRMQDDD